MARYDALFTDRNDRDGLKFKARTGVPANTRFAKDWTVGMCFDLTPSIMLRASTTTSTARPGSPYKITRTQRRSRASGTSTRCSSPFASNPHFSR